MGKLATLDLTGKTIDLSRRYWGQNYEVMDVIDGGQKLRLATWSREWIERFDLLILNNGNETTQYRVDEVDHCRDPRDMAFVTATFAPRKAHP